MIVDDICRGRGREGGREGEQTRAQALLNGDALRYMVYAQSKLHSVFSPLFVTWKKIVNGGEPRLRGCIGTLEARDIVNGFKDYALTRYLNNTSFFNLITRLVFAALYIIPVYYKICLLFVLSSLHFILVFLYIMQCTQGPAISPYTS